jgi:Bromodomain extra-terminal - transcription regulation
MSTPALSLSNEEYEQRRRFFEELKHLSKQEHAKIFEILKQHGAEFSQNSNGVFFDVSKLAPPVFQALQEYMQFCRIVQRDQAEREELQREAQSMIRDM